jgi:uncharacterized repeat protein (TIGR01451 family)
MLQSGAPNKPIVIDAYGSGAKPVIAGSVPLSNWRNMGGNIWQTSCPTCGSRVTGIYANGSVLPLGRYPNLDAPNKGYLTVQTHNGNAEFTSQQPLTTNWTGGEAVIRAVQWILDRATITKQNGNTLSLKNNSAYTPADGWGFFIQNHPATLDQTGEWYYDPTTKTIRLFDNQGNPNQKSITVTVFDNGIGIGRVSNITVRNIEISETLTTGLYALNASNITLSNLDVTDSGEDAVNMMGTGENIVVENSRIINANNNGLMIDNYQHVVVRGNTVRNVGSTPGRGKSGDGNYNGLQFHGRLNTLVENNRIDSIGFNGISFVTSTTIQRNVISNFCMSKSDGGGIYAWNGNKLLTGDIHITSNIIYNSVGALEGAIQNGYTGGNGIFLDDCVANIDLSNNTVFNNHGWGIFLRGDTDVNLVGNTSYDNHDTQLVLYHNGGYCAFRNNVIKQNILVSPSADQLVARYESNANDLDQYGLFDYNFYVRPLSDVFNIRAVHDWSVINEVPLKQWQSDFKQDPNAKGSPLTYPQYKVNSVNSTSRLATPFTNGQEGWAVWSPYGNAQAVWSNENRLDGGSLRASFPTSSNAKDSYMLLTNDAGSATKGRSFLLRFDAVASASKKIQVFIRQKNSPYQDLDQRFDLLIEPTRKSYELAFTAKTDEANALLAFQISEDDKTVWLDNIKLQEASITPTKPEDYIRFVYNPTARDSLVTLDGTYRDVRNHYYSRRVVVAPFRSVVLLRDSLPPGDLSLSLKTGQSTLAVGQVTSFSLVVRNDIPSSSAEKVQWTCRLPPNLDVVNAPGIDTQNGMLTGTVQRLRSDTTFVFQARPTVAGTYHTSAQVTTTTLADPDSTPDSGTGDGEDDAATVTFRVGEPNNNVFSSPNPGQMPLPTLASTLGPADLSLRTELSSRTPAYNQIITCKIIVRNEGPMDVSTVQVQNKLPDGLQFISGTNWLAAGNLLTTTITKLAAKSSVEVSFQAKVIAMGYFVNQTQILDSDTPDPDSIPGNGFTNGEDDEAQADFRVRIINGGTGIFGPNLK